MNFDELKASLGDNWSGVTVFSVENREMTSNETIVHYYLEPDSALRDAESQWELLPNQEERDYHEISVHSGEMDLSGNQLRFIVQRKLYKAYKKVYVCQQFADDYKKVMQEKFMADGMAESEAVATASAAFKEKYTIQPVVRFGMFAGYDYAPVLPQ